MEVARGDDWRCFAPWSSWRCKPEQPGGYSRTMCVRGCPGSNPPASKAKPVGAKPTGDAPSGLAEWRICPAADLPQQLELIQLLDLVGPST